MGTPLGGRTTGSAFGAAVAVLALALAPPAMSRGGYHAAPVHALSAPDCGFVGGALADPAVTQQCLAERYRKPKAKPGDSKAPQPASANAAPAG